jgi:signal transduction histidine kinase
MRRRAESLGGQLDIASAPAGTTVTATLPLEESG